MPELIGPLILFAVAMALTPGPNNIMVTASAANFGFRRVVPHMLGVTLGFVVMLLAVGLGLGGLFQAEPRLHHAMKYLGAAYLLYLAWRIANAGDGGNGAGRPRPISFFEAALFQWINPKAWIIALGALTAYTTVGGAMTREVALIAFVFALVTFPSLAVWAWFGTALGRWLGRPGARAAFNWTMAAFLALSLAPVFW
jgi:threonine/homoserine/homoserine lactone efflux protein